MGAIKEFQELWESQPKHSLIKIILYTISLLIIALLLIVLIKICEGEPVKLFGIEINYGKQSDTTKNSTGIVGIRLSNLKKDSSKIALPNKPRTINNLKKNVIAVSQNKKVDTINKQSNTQKFEFKAPITAPSQFGNNNQQFNQITGKIDRHLDEKMVNVLINYLPIKNRSLTISYETADVESKNFSSELKSILESQGYTNVNLFGHLEIGTPQQPFPISIDTLHYGVSIELNGH